MSFSYSDLFGISPIIAVSVTALVALVVKSLMERGERVILGISAVGMLVSIVFAVKTFPMSTTAFTDMVLV